MKDFQRLRALHARGQFVAELKILRKILGKFLYSADGFFLWKIFKDIAVKGLPYRRVINRRRGLSKIPEYPRLDNGDPADHDAAHWREQSAMRGNGIGAVDISVGDDGQGRLAAYPLEKLPPRPVLELFVEIARMHENRVNAGVLT